MIMVNMSVTGAAAPGLAADGRTFRRRNNLIHGAAISTTAGTAAKWSAEMFLHLDWTWWFPVAFIVLLFFVWLLPMRFWRADR